MKHSMTQWLTLLVLACMIPGLLGNGGCFRTNQAENLATSLSETVAP
ncbi:MAG: hypothetical protein OEM49_00765 [Myxococcales bacterium]|nr:hypothetical protein [Myxococcales bacterium]MDH5305838.1 hypothetical protein [Myxococcales bacterium]MDH5565851.1 hypothetical protein [Myxococcales bacterium]